MKTTLPRWRWVASLTFVFGLALAMTGGTVLLTSASPSLPEYICHRTNSESNPYVMIDPDIASIVKGSGHDSHNGPVWAAGDKAAGITWGDIIPSFTYTGVEGDKYDGSYPGQNWTAAGQAIYNNGCEGPGVVEPTTTPETSPTPTPETSPSPSASPSPTPTPETSPSPSASPSPTPTPETSPSPSASPSASSSPTPPAGGVAGATATPNGEVLAATGMTSPSLALGVFLIAFGLFAMTGGVIAWRRRVA